MRVVFFGTPEVAVPSLEALLASSHEVTAVVTQPDKPRGRGRAVSPSPVKQIALDRDLPVIEPASPKAPGFVEALQVFEPEVLTIVAYGHILPIDVLSVAPAVNVHFSLLPRYRGAAPVQRALMDGVAETGVSVFLLEPTVDTGPVVLREKVAVGPDETSGDVLARLAPLGAELLVRTLDGMAAGTLEPQPQEDAVATPAPKIRSEETQIDWARPASKIVDLVRALNPRPGAHTFFRGKRLMVWRARLADGTGAAGTILHAGRDGIVIAAGEGAVRLIEVGPEGKRAMSGAEFVRGYRPEEGESLA